MHLKKAGLNTNVYEAHSCRATSTSKERSNGVSVTEVLKRGWWKSKNNFRTFYSKDIINQNSRESTPFLKRNEFMINLNKSEKYRVKIYSTMEFIYTYKFTKEFKPYHYFQKMKIYKLC